MNDLYTSKTLDLAKLLSGEKEEISFDYSLDSSFEENGIDLSSFRFSGKVTCQYGSLLLSGTITGCLEAPCARCLAPVAQAFSTEVTLPVRSPDQEATDEDAIPLNGQSIDLSSLFWETVLTSLPLRLLCREDCKGLCPKCGQDLNEKACSCTKIEVDPRLAGLKDFFEEK